MMEDCNNLDMLVKGKRKRDASTPFVPHKDIEKRRRERVNGYIKELSTIMPNSRDTAQKVDKLTVLRLAIEYMRNLAGDNSEKPEAALSAEIPASYSGYKDILPLALEAALSEKFFIVIGCDSRLRVLHMTKNAKKTLQVDLPAVLGTSFIELLHPFDVAEVKRQIHTEALLCKDKNSFNFSTGSRRSFYCRIKVGTDNKKRKMSKESKDNKQTKEGKQYALVNMTGYLKPWESSTLEVDEAAADLGCFVAIAAVYNTFSEEHVLERAQKFDTKHTADGTFLSCCPNTTLITGHLPQDLLNNSSYTYYHEDDLEHISLSHYQLLANNYCETNTYRFLCSEAGRYISVLTLARLFRNPFNQKPEMLLCTSILVQCGIPLQINLNYRGKVKKLKGLKDEETLAVQEFCDLKEKVETYMLKPTISTERVKKKQAPPENKVNSIGSLVLAHYEELSSSTEGSTSSDTKLVESDVSSPGSICAQQDEMLLPSDVLLPVQEPGEMPVELEQMTTDVTDSVKEIHQQVCSDDPVVPELPEPKTLNDAQFQEIQQLIENQKHVQAQVLKILESRGKEVVDDEVMDRMQISQLKQPQLQICPVDKLIESLETSAPGVPANRFSSQVQFATPIIPGLAPLHKNLLSSYPRNRFENISEEELNQLRDGGLQTNEPVGHEGSPMKELNSEDCGSTALLNQDTDIDSNIDLPGVLPNEDLIPSELLVGDGDLDSATPILMEDGEAVPSQIMQSFMCNDLPDVSELRPSEELQSLLQQENSDLDTEKIVNFDAVSESGSECLPSSLFSNAAITKGSLGLPYSSANNLLGCSGITPDDISLPSEVLHSCDVPQVESLQNIFDFLITDIGQ